MGAGFSRWGVGRVFAGLCSAALLMVGGAAAVQAQQEEKVLNIYNWSDYIGPDVIKNLEKETGIKVRYDNFGSANPNKETRKFVVPEVANNPAVFPTPAQLATMVPPKSMTNDMRRLQTRVFTAFKTGR